MCGLVGVIPKLSSGLWQRDVDMFEDMLYMDALRGEDATGICLVTEEQGAVVLKEASHAYYFTYTKEYNEERPEFIKSGRALLGHNRKATMGKTGEDKNAHPFVLNDRYVFFHNGTLHNHKSLHDTDVDSEALGMVLTECEGHKEKLEEALGKVFGAYACVWYDTEKNNVYFIRNKERPLCLYRLKSGDIIYSSEPGIALAAIWRRGSSIEENIDIKEHFLYTLNLNTFDLVAEELSPKKAKPQATPTHTKSAATTGTNTVSKNMLKRLKRRFLKDDVITFELEDAVPSTQNPGDAECVDWYLMGTPTAETGVEVHGTIKNQYEHDIMKLFKKLGTARVYDAEIRNNKLVLYVNNIQFHKKREIAYVH